MIAGSFSNRAICINIGVSIMGFIWKNIARPLLFSLDAERAHEWGMWALRSGIAARLLGEAERELPSGLAVKRFGLEFTNPLGLAAGFDKNGVAPDQLEKLGFGFVEVGTVTLKPQPGNDRPRLFRLPNDGAIINRLGFNNDGAEVVAKRLASADHHRIIGINIGKNKEVPNEEAIENYLKCLELIYPAADYIAINVSSPNTPGLRELQKDEALGDLLSAILGRATELSAETSLEADSGQRLRKPILVKIAPDLTDREILKVADICSELGVDGIIATNTTTSREGLGTAAPAKIGAGGLSGRPLAARSNSVISLIFRHTAGNLPIIGVGGVFSAADAFEKIAAGAVLVQAYTGFVYGGPRFPVEVLSGLAEILDERGFGSVDEAVGSGAGV